MIFFLMSDEQEMTNSNAGNVCVILLHCWRCFSISYYPHEWSWCVIWTELQDQIKDDWSLFALHATFTPSRGTQLDNCPQSPQSHWLSFPDTGMLRHH